MNLVKQFLRSHARSSSILLNLTKFTTTVHLSAADPGWIVTKAICAVNITVYAKRKYPGFVNTAMKYDLIISDDICDFCFADDQYMSIKKNRSSGYLNK